MPQVMCYLFCPFAVMPRELSRVTPFKNSGSALASDDSLVLDGRTRKYSSIVH